MILACGIPTEAPMRLVIEAAARLGVELILFNQRLSAQIELEYTATTRGAATQGRTQQGGLDRADTQVRLLRIEGVLHLPDGDYPLEAFSGVYLRLMDYQDLPEFVNNAKPPADKEPPLRFNGQGLNPEPVNLLTASQQRIYTAHESLVNWLEVAPLRVMNRLSAMGSNQSKPYQAQLIAQAGFSIPPTLITNDPEAVRTFQQTYPRVIYKSISAVRSVVRELGRSAFNELEKIRYLPTQFQAYIPGENIRVHVAGERVFATRIRSDAIDYRYAGQAGLDFGLEEVYIEEEVTERCLRLSRLLELPLCGIDLKRTPSGELYCFEANPSPAFSFYQEPTGQDIAAAVVSYLSQ